MQLRLEEFSLRKWTTIALQGLVVSIVVSALVLLFTSSGDTLQLMREHVRWPLVPLLALPVFVSWGCNGLRFHLMCRCIDHPIALSRAWAIAVSSEFGIAATPGGIGGTATRLGFLKRSGISYVHGASLLAADLFLDLIFFLLIIPFALAALLRYLDWKQLVLSREPNPAWLLIILLLAALLLGGKPLYRAIRRRPFIRKYRLDGRSRLARRNLTRGFRQGRIAIALIFRHHRPALLINLLLTAVQFTSRYSVLPLTIWMLGIPVNPLPLILIQGVLFMIGIAVVAPGGGGSVEALAAFALGPFVPVHLIGVAILLWRFFTYHFYLLFGGAVFAATFKRLNKNITT